MKNLIIILLFFSFTLIADASTPSKNIIKSCLTDEAVNNVILIRIPKSITSDDNYKSGFSADYLTYDGKDFGYATKKNQQAIVYDQQLFPVESAKYIQPATANQIPEKINIYIAAWLFLKEQNKKFLCVSDFLGGIPISSHFQSKRYGYLLSLTGKKELYFVTGDWE